MRRLTLVLLLLLAAPAQATIVAEPPVPAPAPHMVVELDRAGGATGTWVSDRGVYTARQLPDGTWDAAERLGNAKSGWIAPGKDGGGAVVLSTHPDDLEPATAAVAPRQDDGSYGAPEDVPLPPKTWLDHPTGWVLDDGTIVVVTTQYQGGFKRSVLERRPDGSWSQPRVLADVVEVHAGTRAGGRLVLLVETTDAPNGRLATIERRDDGTWSTPAGISDPQRLSYVGMLGQRLASDDAGNLAVGYGSGPPELGDSAQQLRLATQPADAPSWSSVAVSDFGSRPAVALSPNGTLAVAWVQGVTGTLLRFPDGRTEMDYGSIFESNGETPSMAVDDAGHIALLERDGRGDTPQLELYVRDPAGCFQRRAALTPPGTVGVGKVQLRGDGSGLAHWTTRDGTTRTAVLKPTTTPAPPCPADTPKTLVEALKATGVDLKQLGFVEDEPEDAATDDEPAPLALAGVPRSISRKALVRRGLRVRVRTRRKTRLKFSVATARSKRVLGRRTLTVRKGDRRIRVRVRRVRRATRRIRLTVRARAGGRTVVRTRVVRVKR